MRTFSGTGEFDPEVFEQTAASAEGNAAYLAGLIVIGQCPRCEGPLPTAPEFPAGSRITRCRTIPICARCGADEAYEAEFDGGVSDADVWPLSVDEIEMRIAAVEAASTLVTGPLVDGHLLTDVGVFTVANRPNTGGWEELGDASV